MVDKIAEAEITANAAISKDCARIGVYIESPWDLVGSHRKYEMTLELASILATHLLLPYPDKIIHGLLAAVSRTETRLLLLRPVIILLKKGGKSYLGQSAANALLRITSLADVGLLQKLVQDYTLEDSRGLLMEKYAKLAKKEAIPILRITARDASPFIHMESLKQLSKLGDQTIRNDLEVLAKHTDSEYRKVARQSLMRLNKAVLKTKN